jgi:hypothetical protein
MYDTFTTKQENKSYIYNRAMKLAVIKLDISTVRTLQKYNIKATNELYKWVEHVDDDMAECIYNYVSEHVHVFPLICNKGHTVQLSAYTYNLIDSDYLEYDKIYSHDTLCDHYDGGINVIWNCKDNTNYKIVYDHELNMSKLVVVKQLSATSSITYITEEFIEAVLINDDVAAIIYLYKNEMLDLNNVPHYYTLNLSDLVIESIRRNI